MINSQTHINNTLHLYLGSYLKITGVILLMTVCWKTLTYPIWPLGLAGIFLIYGIALWKYSTAWLLVIPAALPIFDFAPWTGRFFLSEFDYLILLTLAINLWLKRLFNPFKHFKRLATLLISLFSLCYLISLLNGIFPLQEVNANAFTNFYSHYNSLRVAKGLVWACLLLPCLSYNYHHHPTQTKTYFSYGILLGLSGVILFSIWERIVFPELLNYTDQYRITSMFSSMHTGGGHIDTYLVIVMPFITLLFINLKPDLYRYLFGISLLSSSLYVLLVTFSRGPYIAFVIQLIVLSIYLTWVQTKWNKLFFIPLFIIITLISKPVLEGEFIQQRFADIEKDFEIRKVHWLDAIQMMQDGFFTSFTGMGLGTYPKTYFWNNSENTVPATFMLSEKNNKHFLQLGSGDPLYVEQIISTQPFTKYLLSLDIRSNNNHSRISIPICEKSLLYSYTCIQNLIPIKTEKDHWYHIEHIIDTKTVGENKNGILQSLFHRPTKLTLYNSNKNAIIDIKNISLLTPNYQELIKNGSFSNELDYWFFTTDNHLPWHTKNIWIQIFFDQGWTGVILFFLLIAYAFVHQFTLLKQKNHFSAILITSLIGFIIEGTAASPFDAPRITLLFFLLLFMALFDNTNQSHESIKI